MPRLSYTHPPAVVSPTRATCQTCTEFPSINIRHVLRSECEYGIWTSTPAQDHRLDGVRVVPRRIELSLNRISTSDRLARHPGLVISRLSDHPRRCRRSDFRHRWTPSSGWLSTNPSLSSTREGSLVPWQYTPIYDRFRAGPSLVRRGSFK